MTDLGSIYGTDIDGVNTFIIDFSNVQINGTLNLPDSSNNGYGLAGQVLTSNGASAAVSWTTPSAPTPSIGSAYYQVNAIQNNIPNNQFTFITYGDEVIANPIITRTANNKFTFNEAGTYKIEASVWLDNSLYALQYTQLNINFTDAGGTQGVSETVFDGRTGAQTEDFNRLSLSIFYVRPNVSVGDSIQIGIYPIFSAGTLSIPAATETNRGSTKLLITKVA